MKYDDFSFFNGGKNVLSYLNYKLFRNVMNDLNSPTSICLKMLNEYY